MSQENVEIVRGQFEATNRRDFAAAMDAYTEDVVLVVNGLFPSGTFLGPRGGRRLVRRLVRRLWP
jgi:ketosteroid isomerase-like protein